jgi:hypothetical protein
MGLAQQFRFKYNSEEEVESFFKDLKDSYSVSRRPSGLFVIKPQSGDSFVFDAAIEDYGLLTHRSGEYFEFVGFVVEQLTGVFGKLEVEDE